MKSTGRITPDLKRLMNDSYDTCRSCHMRLVRDVAAYAGYDKDKKPIYVGICCERLIDELATHVYWWWRDDIRPDTDTPLWRYMDFAKFVALIQHRGLYFARADRLGDPFEGARGIAERRSEWENYCLDYFRDAIRSAPRGDIPVPESEEVERQATKLLHDFQKMGEWDLLRSYLSCWHANSVEPEALWRLYCPPGTVGMAIRTDPERLKLALGDDPDIQIGKVLYADFRERFAGTYDRIYWKRKSLSHEAEVRLVIEEPSPTDELGLWIPADLNTLVTGVVVSPFAFPWFADVVKATMHQFDVDLPLIPSEMLAEPFF